MLLWESDIELNQCKSCEAKCYKYVSSASGTSVDRDFKLVFINQTRCYNKYEPFILASQAIQVYYCTDPSKNNVRGSWQLVKLR